MSESLRLGLQSLALSGNVSAVYNPKLKVVKSKPSTTMAVPIGLIVSRSLRLFKLFLATQLVLRSGDVMLNPGPQSNISFDRSDICEESFLSKDSESKRKGHFDASASLPYGDESQSYFNLGLPNRGIRIGHWNVNCLTSSKLDQIKQFLNDKNEKPQVDVLWLNETFLKPDIPDSFYSIPGFTIFRRDRQTKNGGGILAFVSDELSVTRRDDLEDSNLEILWLEVAPFKSKRSLLLAGVYRPPSSTKADNSAFENNIEKADILNKEIILFGDFNIDATNPEIYKKHRLSKGLIAMNFKQLVTETTRPVRETCLDHILTNKPQSIHNIVIPDIGLSDHLPVFEVRQYNRNSKRVHQQKGHVYIKYRNMKVFNEEQFKSTLKESPWDSVFVSEDIDDILSAWE